MRLRKLVLVAMLIAIGFIMHAISPPFFFGMRPDFSLAMLFVAILIIEDNKISIVAGIAVGIISALTTTFPMGQIPNIVDKLVTTAAVLVMVKILPKTKIPFIRTGIIGFVGTVISGTVFLGTALALAGLPAPFMALFMAVVIPAALFNTVFTGVAFHLTKFSQKVVKPRYISE